MENNTVKGYQKKIKKYEKDIRIVKKWWNNYIKKINVTLDQINNYNGYMQYRKDKIAFYTESLKKVVAEIYEVKNENK